MAKSTTLGIPSERPAETPQTGQVTDDELLLSLFFPPDTGAALDEVEALAEDDLHRLLIF